jgi:carotenoid cleavage dioxygenase-like enzyme
MMHDCAITAAHTIILDFPLYSNGLQFDVSVPSRFGVMPRHAESEEEIVWIEVPAFYAFHVANAWERKEPAANGDGTDHTIITIVCGATPKLDMTGRVY